MARPSQDERMKRNSMRKRKPIAEIRKPEIVAAALKAINKHGLPIPSYDIIAAEADMSRQLIRHYFPEPETLMLAICDALAASYRDCLTKGVLEAKSTQRLSVFLDFYFGFLSDKGIAKPVDDAVYDAMFSLATGSAAIRHNLNQQYSLLQFTIAHEIQVSHPGLSQTACKEIGFLLVGLMYGHWKMVATLGFSEDYNKVSRAAMDRIIESYLQRYEEVD